MSTRSCVAVLVGSETASRQWVKYEIEKAWSDKKGLFGIYIHNLKCPRKGVGQKGANPFEQYKLGEKDFSSVVKCYQPNVFDAYNDIKNNIDKWVEEAISIRQKY